MLPLKLKQHVCAGPGWLHLPRQRRDARTRGGGRILRSCQCHHAQGTLQRQQLVCTAAGEGHTLLRTCTQQLLANFRVGELTGYLKSDGWGLTHMHGGRWCEGWWPRGRASRTGSPRRLSSPRWSSSCLQTSSAPAWLRWAWVVNSQQPAMLDMHGLGMHTHPGIPLRCISTSGRNSLDASNLGNVVLCSACPSLS